MKPEEIKTRVQEVLTNGNWMLRISRGGRCYNGFQWAPVGEWTEAPDWNDRDECGGGLHGNDEYTVDTYWAGGDRMEFCEYDPTAIKRIDGAGGKLKVRRARILLIHEIPEQITDWVGDIVIPAGTKCVGLTTVGGDAYIEADAPALTTVGGDAYIHANAPALTTVGGSAVIKADAPALTTVGGYAYIYADGGAPKKGTPEWRANIGREAALKGTPLQLY